MDNFFLLMPCVSCVFFPALCMNIKNRAFDLTLPFCTKALFLSRAAAALFVFAVALFFTIPVPICASHFFEVDFGEVFCGYAGMIFFAAAALSFCLFLSIFVSNRAAYFSICVLLLCAINLVHFLPAAIPLSDLFSNIVKTTSFAWHFDSAKKGVFDTRDFVFYAVSATFFLWLCEAVFEAKKGKNFFSLKKNVSGKTPAFSAATFLFILFFILLDSNHLYKRIDLSKSKQYSISQYTKNLISSASEKIRITYYRSNELLKFYPQIRDVSFFLKTLSLENKNVFCSEFAAEKLDESSLLKMGIRPYQIQILKNKRTEYANVYSAVMIEYLGEAQVIPMCFSTFALEFDIAIRVDFLLNKTQRNVYVMSGGNSTLENDFKVSQQWLNLEGFKTIPIKSASAFFENLEKNAFFPLVLYGTKNLSKEDCAAIENFVLNGGSIFAMTSPYCANIKGGWEISENFDDNFLFLLEKWGVRFERALAADASNVRPSFYSVQNDDPLLQKEFQYVNYPLWINLAPQKNAKSGLEFFWASPIVCEKENAKPLFFTSNSSWKILPFEHDFQIKNSLFETNPFAFLDDTLESPLSKKERSVLGAEIFFSKKSRVVVLSSPYFVSDLVLSLAGGENGDVRNLNFLSAELFRLAGEEELSALKERGTSNITANKITDKKKFLSATKKTFVINFLGVPLAIFAIMAMFFAKRKNSPATSA